MKLRHSALSCALVILLSACGGSSGTTENTNQTQITQIPDDIAIGLTPEDIDSTLTSAVTEFPPVYRTPEGVEECSAEDIKLRVDFDMRDYYVFYDQVPTLNLDDYDTPERLIRDLRVDPDIYSYVTDAAELSALNGEGVSGGFGFWLARTADDSVRFREVLVGSSAFSEDILRGDELLAVNGIALADITDEQVDEAFDPDNAPINLTIQTAGSAAREVFVDHTDFRWVTAGPASRTVFDDPSLPVVGMLPIRRFLETTEDEIVTTFDNLQELGGFDELIVDLRYNPGGLTDVTRRLASYIGGEAVANEVFLIRKWNDKYSENDTTNYFEEFSEPLNMPRVIVLVTEFSSSASEVFINTLEPYIDVVVLGGVTGGKPFTSNSREYCGKAINAMRSLRTNANGVSVAGGIQPDCPVVDAWDYPTYSTLDPLFGAALEYLSTGTCPATVMAESVAFRSSVAQGSFYRAPEPMVSEQ